MTKGVAAIARKVLRNIGACKDSSMVLADEWASSPAHWGELCTIRELRRLAEFADGKPVEVVARRKRK